MRGAPEYLLSRAAYMPDAARLQDSPDLIRRHPPSFRKPRSEVVATMLDLHHRLKRWRAKHNQGFDGPAPVTEVSVNLKIDVQRVGLNLHKSGLGAAYWARVCWLEHEQLILKTHVLTLRATLVRCGLRTLEKVLFES
jgi:hypothetical protein